MRFKQYIINEGRSIEMDFNDALNTIKKDCSKALDQYKNKKNNIYRGISHNKKSLYIDPKVGKPRKSSSTQNYYTLIMDNSKKWSKYPKRSESIICSTDYNTAKTYDGVTYIVFPFNGAKIGVCEQYDLWSSFDTPENLFTLNNMLYETFDNLNIKLDDTNFNTFKKSFKSFDIKMKNPDIRNKIINKKNTDYFIFKYYKDDLLKALEKLFDPKNNNFKLMKIGDDLPFNREVWTDSKSIMLKLNIHTKIKLKLL